MTTWMPKTLGLLAVCGVLWLGVTACGGGGAEVRSEVSTTTAGSSSWI